MTWLRLHSIRTPLGDGGQMLGRLLPAHARQVAMLLPYCQKANEVPPPIGIYFPGRDPPQKSNTVFEGELCAATQFKKVG
jgi:hypothetical protein